MNVTQDIAEPERTGRLAAPHDRPETARPPVDVDTPAPAEDPIDMDGRDIDALLPVAFDTGAARVTIGQDLADLLRAAEERLDARGEVESRPNETDDNVADVPVPEDVLSLLAEPLEAEEDEIGTGVAQGSVVVGTGADRPATLDGPMPTAHGQDDDLEQPLPRKASTMPRDPAARPSEPYLESASARTGAGTLPPEPDARPVTAIGRSTSSLPPGRGTTSHGITAELAMREAIPTPERGIPTREVVPTPERGLHMRDIFPTPERGLHMREGTPDRGVPIRRGAPLDRASPPERGAPDRGAAADRGVADRSAGADRGMSDRSAAADRGMSDRGAAAERGFSDRGAGADRGMSDRSAGAERGGYGERALISDRSATFERDHGAQIDRGVLIDRGAALIERAAMGERAALGERPTARMVERASHGDAARWQTAKMVSPAAIEGSDPPRSRASRTDATPAVLGPGDAPRALGRAIASRVSGALVIASGDDQRRVVLHDGDVVTAGSSAPVESLVAFLAARGDLDRDLVPRLTGKLPPFGRHAGAALVAHGYLGQDDLWPVLRAHAEWVMGRAILVESGTCELEVDPPARYKAEPSVFGGATGAEVFIDTIQRVIAPEAALARLGGYGARIAPGPRPGMLAECALSPSEEEAMRAAPGHTVHQFTGDGPSERWSLLYGLVCLEVLDALPAVAAPKAKAETLADPLDDEALRARVRARLALVEEGDYFALLGVPRTATSYEIRRAYLELRRTFEPARILTATTADLADDVRLVVEVVEEAYEILRDAPRRERYRRAIEAGPPR